MQAFPYEFKIIELGTGVGSTLLPLALACKYRKGKVYTIDLIRNETLIREKLKTIGAEEYVEFFTRNDISQESINFLLNHEQTFNLIFIDTSHDYYQTLFELRIYSEFIIKDGYIVLHDTKRENSYRVRKAMEKFLEENKNFVLSMDIEEGIAGLAILRKIK